MDNQMSGMMTEGYEKEKRWAARGFHALDLSPNAQQKLAQTVSVRLDSQLDLIACACVSSGKTAVSPHTHTLAHTYTYTYTHRHSQTHKPTNTLIHTLSHARTRTHRRTHR
jgi:hypothetical protein